MKKEVIGFFISLILISIAFFPLTSADLYKTDKVENYSTENLVNNNENVKITVEFCSRYNSKENEIFLTSDQTNQLYLLIDDFNKKLEDADTLNENIEIYKDMIGSLDSLGLIPKTISKEKAKLLVTKNNQLHALFEHTKNQPKSLDDNENILCLISGSTEDGAWIDGPVKNFLTHLINFLVNIGRESKIEVIALLMFAVELIKLYPVFEYGHNIIPFRAMERIGFGGYYYDEYYNKIKFSATANVDTYGLNGKKQWDGEIYGQLPVLPILNLFNSFHTGVVGFTGIRITFDREGGLENFFLGTALWVKIGTAPPS